MIIRIRLFLMLIPESLAEIEAQIDTLNSKVWNMPGTLANVFWNHVKY